jgi:hypothetical protein
VFVIIVLRIAFSNQEVKLEGVLCVCNYGSKDCLQQSRSWKISKCNDI